MAVNTVTSVGSVGTSSTADVQHEQQRARLAFSETSTFERASSSNLGGSYTPVGQGDTSVITSFYSAYDSATQSSLHNTAAGWGMSAFGSGQSDEDLVSSGSTALITFLTGAGSADHQQAVSAFMAEALSGPEAYLREYGAKVQKLTELTIDLRESRTALQELINEWPEGEETQTFSWNEVTIDADGNPVVTAHENEPLTKEEAQQLLEDLDGMKQSVSEVSQLAQYDLQTKTEEYERIVQILTAIAEEDNRNKTSVINNFK